MRKKILRTLALWFLPPIGAFFIYFIYLTSKKRFHFGSIDGSKICVFWHGDLLMQSFLYHKLMENKSIKVLVSDHFDGEIIAKVAWYLKIGTIRGSSTRGGAKALINALKSIDDGYSIALTPDGPKGPRHSMSDGAVAMAKKKGIEVVAFSVVPSSFWQFKSWDKFVIPKPFSQIDFYASEPINVESLSVDDANTLIKSKLLEHRYADIV